MQFNHSDQRQYPIYNNSKLPLRHIPSAHEFKIEKTSKERVSTISPRLLHQKQNSTLFDVASLWNPPQAGYKNKEKVRQNQGEEYGAGRKVTRRDSSKSKSPTAAMTTTTTTTTFAKPPPKQTKPARITQTFMCEQTIVTRPTQIKPKIRERQRQRQREQINQAVTIKPTFLHKNMNPIEIELAQFDNMLDQINGESEAEQIVYLSNYEDSYSVDPWYLRRHSKLDWQSRAILVEWIMQVQTQFLLKRQTFHLSINLIDLFLSKTTTQVLRKNLQAIGSVCMYIASKIQEQEAVSITKISKCSMDKYSCDSLLEIEQSIVKTLKWSLNPPTIDNWASRVMQQWDLFVESPMFLGYFPSLKSHPHPFFKKTDELSYKNYRELMQLIDCSVADIQTLQYKPRLLVCSFLYLILGKYYCNFKPKQISQEFPDSSLYLLDSELPLNAIYSKFLEFTFGLLLFDLLPTIQFCATFFILPVNFDIPNIELEAPGMNAEEYVTYQTYNPYTMSTIKQKRRDIAQQ